MPSHHAPLPALRRYAIVQAMIGSRLPRFALVFLSLVFVSAFAVAGAACSKKDDKDKTDKDKKVKKTKNPASGGGIVRAKPDGTNKKTAPVKKPPLKKLAVQTGKHALKHSWSLRFGDKRRDNARGIATDSRGNIYMVGLFSGKVDFGNKKPLDSGKQVNVFLTKYDSEGALKWVKSIGNKGEEDASAVAVDKDDNVIVVGLFSNQLRIGSKLLDAEHEADNIFVAKFDDEGKLQWATDFGADGNEVANGLAVDSAGNILVTGTFQQFIDFGAGKLRSVGNNDVFITKLTPKGKLVWARSMGALHDDVGRALAVDVQDNVYLGADLTRNTKLDGKKLDIKGQTDAAVIKFDSNGKVVWATTVGGAFQEILVGLAVDPAGGVIATGGFKDKMTVGGETFKSKGNSDIFIVKLDSKGKVAWTRAYGNRYKDVGASVSTNKFGTIMVTGWFESTVDFGNGKFKSAGNKDIFLLKLSADGKHLWSSQYGAKGDDTARAILIDDDGVVTVSGTFRFEVDFGGNPLDSARDLEKKLPAGDAFLTRFTPVD